MELKGFREIFMVLELMAITSEAVEARNAKFGTGLNHKAQILYDVIVNVKRGDDAKQ